MLTVNPIKCGVFSANFRVLGFIVGAASVYFARTPTSNPVNTNQGRSPTLPTPRPAPQRPEPAQTAPYQDRTAGAARIASAAKHNMARSDRRRLARALLAGIPASLLLARAASAQPAVGAPWPMCASATQSYCIAAATRDGEPTDGPGNGPYEGGVLVPYAVLTDANTVSWGMKWNLDESSMPGSIGGSILVRTWRHSMQVLRLIHLK